MNAAADRQWGDGWLAAWEELQPMMAPLRREAQACATWLRALRGARSSMAERNAPIAGVTQNVPQ